jgi:hypothetical protein
MIGKATLIAGLFAVGTAFGSMGASAAPALPQSLPADGSLVLQVKHRHHHHHHHHHHRHHRFGGVILYGAGIYGGYCVSWRHECAARWGWHTRGFYRCLARHGC